MCTDKCTENVNIACPVRNEVQLNCICVIAWFECNLVYVYKSEITLNTFSTANPLRRPLGAYKRSQGMVPSYLKDCLKKNCENHSRSTRYCNLNFLCPNVKRKTQGGRIFAVSACIEWNSLPIKTKRVLSVKTFRKTLLSEALNEQKYLSHFNP